MISSRYYSRGDLLWPKQIGDCCSVILSSGCKFPSAPHSALPLTLPLPLRSLDDFYRKWHPPELTICYHCRPITFHHMSGTSSGLWDSAMRSSKILSTSCCRSINEEEKACGLNLDKVIQCRGARRISYRLHLRRGRRKD